MRVLFVLMSFVPVFSLFGQVPSPPFLQCPAIGLNTSCRILIYIDANGGQRVLTDPNVSATFDGADDTLIGVLNMSANPVASIPLTSTTDIFNFDGDGICSSSITPHPAACPFGPTGYEGPGVSYASINGTYTSGVVNFSPAIAANGGTAYFGLEEAIPTTCPDADGDGLCDDWEINGLTVYVNGSPVFIDLPAMGANPNHKDIFIQTDYMVGADHTHKPISAAVALATQVFANAPVSNPDGTNGITLHVDCGPTCIMNPKTGQTWGAFSKAMTTPHQDSLGSATGNVYSWAAFDAIKQVNFSVARQQVFHYVIFAHNLGGLGTTSGISRGITASDYIVSLGGWNNQTGIMMQQAGTLVHELGHNLSLQHGGTDGVNYKPNFLSVMNYFFQMKGLAVNGAQTLLDYSRFSLPSLNETALNEAVGLNGGAAITNYGTLFYCPGAAASTFVANANGNIDWNCNGAIEASVATDINNDGAKTTLTTYNDWPNLVYAGGSIGGLGIAVTPPAQTTVVPELTPPQNAQITTPLSVALTSTGIIQALPGSTVNVLFTVTNAGTQADTYALTAASTVAWGTLGSVPASVSLAAGASFSFTIPVTVPAGTAIGVSGDFTVKAVSNANTGVQDIRVSTVVASSTITPAGIQALVGSGQSAPINTAFGTLLQAAVTGAGNSPATGATVTFTAPASGASGTFAGGSAAATVIAGAFGIATAPAFTANGTAGGPYNVTASVAGVTTPATFVLTNTTTANPFSVKAISGSGQSAALGATFGTPLQATVTDASNNPVVGVTVTFTAPGSGASGTFAGGSLISTAITNGLGVATALTFNANNVAGGPYNVSATVGGASAAANFVLTNSAAVGGSIKATQGSGQSAALNATFGTALQATVTDANNNPVAGATVTFTAPSAGASGTFPGGAVSATSITNASGLATAPTFTATGTTGSYSVNASTPAATGTAVFGLTNTTPQLGVISVSSGSGQGATPSSAYAAALVALLTDASGNPQAGVPVTFFAPAAGASIVFANNTNVATTLTNAQGLAASPAFSSNSLTGTFPVTASSGNVAGATFILTNIFTIANQKMSPTIVWAAPAPIPYGQPLDVRQLNATASVPGTFVYLPAAGTILNPGLTTLTAVFTPANTTLYFTASASVSLLVIAPTPPSISDQTITFPLIPDHVVTDGSFTLSASASSGLPVTYRVVYGPATVSGNLVTLTGFGRVDIEASQAGNANFTAASSLDRNFLVLGPVPSITSIVNTATNVVTNLLPGAMSSLLGTNLAVQTVTAAMPSLQVQIGGVTMIFADANGVATPMLLAAVSPTRIDFVVPAGVALGTGTMKLSTGTGQSVTMAMTVGRS